MTSFILRLTINENIIKAPLIYRKYLYQTTTIIATAVFYLSAAVFILK